MSYVIVNEDGEFYGGFDGKKGAPVWFKAQRKECALLEPVAELALSQLTQLGFAGLSKREI